MKLNELWMQYEADKRILGFNPHTYRTLMKCWEIISLIINYILSYQYYIKCLMINI
ncbi:hypothetical protein [Clostridium estertheticum]|uniref:hypothetical protein n=1 Tax=Clostridium estertheticum TaxID=238834 RepID=UPI001CF516F7|nr:hypothetical protein [Clostridium estertheticum]MCB2353019.1 hypothetical protein [Clostridium estertheticum]